MHAAFQQLEVDYFVGPPSAHSLQVHRTDLNEVPILRMYGVTDAGACLVSTDRVRCCVGLQHLMTLSNTYPAYATAQPRK